MDDPVEGMGFRPEMDLPESDFGGAIAGVVTDFAVGCVPEMAGFARVRSHEGQWWRGRDSNPRYQLTQYDGLANRCLQPLGHLSRLWGP
jgi:hypothetical protein